MERVFKVFVIVGSAQCVAADSEARGQAKANSDPVKSSRWSNESNRSHRISLVEEIHCSTTPDSFGGRKYSSKSW